jgi:hypothetical protein
VVYTRLDCGYGLSVKRVSGARRGLAAAAGSDTGDYGIGCWYKGSRQKVGFDTSETDAERARRS